MSVCGYAVTVDQRLAVALTETLEHGKPCCGKRRAERTAAVQSAGGEDQRTAFGPEVEQRQLIILTEHLPEEIDQPCRIFAAVDDASGDSSLSEM